VCSSDLVGVGKCLAESSVLLDFPTPNPSPKGEGLQKKNQTLGSAIVAISQSWNSLTGFCSSARGRQANQ